MARSILILGESKKGKSFSGRTLDPKKTFWISTYKAELPFRGWRKNYPNVKKGGNFTIVKTAEKIIGALKYGAKQGYKNIVLDDFQFMAGFKMIKDAKVKGYDKFTEIAQKFLEVNDEIKDLPEDVTVFILSHIEDDGKGGYKAKTAGKMVDNVLGFEALFTTVIQADVDHSKPIDKMRYFFSTQNDGHNTVGSPLGMFPNEIIPNDLQYVLDCMDAYDNDEAVPEIQNSVESEIVTNNTGEDIQSGEAVFTDPETDVIEEVVPEQVNEIPQEVDNVKTEESIESVVPETNVVPENKSVVKKGYGTAETFDEKIEEITERLGGIESAEEFLRSKGALRPKQSIGSLSAKQADRLYGGIETMIKLQEEGN